MQGSFNITCRCLPDRTTAIGQQVVSAPWHLSKPYWDGKILLIQAVNATAGIFSGDHLEMNVRVEQDASVLLTSPSASRIHTMPNGEASLLQNIHVAAGAWLEWMPELFIPHRKCRYRQKTEIRADKSASLYFVETLAPGRVAHGESFAFDKLNWTTRIWYDDRLVLAENYPMNPADQSLRDLSENGKARYFASAILIHSGELPFREWQKLVMEWNSDSVHIGGTNLAPAVYLFRIITDSSEQLKLTLFNLRDVFSRTIPELKQTARKL